MKINAETHVEIKEVLVKKEVQVQKIVIEIDQDFLDVINGIGRTSYASMVSAGMTEQESVNCTKFYDIVLDNLISSGLVMEGGDGSFSLM